VVELEGTNFVQLNTASEAGIIPVSEMDSCIDSGNTLTSPSTAAHMNRAPMTAPLVSRTYHSYKSDKESRAKAESTRSPDELYFNARKMTSSNITPL